MLYFYILQVSHCPCFAAAFLDILDYIRCSLLRAFNLLCHYCLFSARL